ncbi:ArsR family transcriptional regulator [Natronocalculus amylovorans]|uniref:ArsR family transcriptional regulator n=1 Tax=Natronocalculus amylovorans TaxID=2917812 RepID=A0AAE3G2A4_9EURY|nr:ArsR family transcriptional regulator [Natronocalculus amylovorans]MCL9818389.1 ArsR family transcriptional regulator [Natronocalculus amylovorans]
MATSKQLDPEIQYIRQLAESGFSDVLTLRRDTAERVLTKKRVELIKEISDQKVDSVRDLSRRVDRDVSIVSRDLDILFEADIIKFERNGRAKQPVLAHKNVFVEPIVYDGAVLTE